jgi:hypothetical protein
LRELITELEELGFAIVVSRPLPDAELVICAASSPPPATGDRQVFAGRINMCNLCGQLAGGLLWCVGHDADGV